MRKSIECTPGFCIGAALMLLILPLQWILAVAIAAAVHEICHMVVLKICGVRIYGVQIGMGGAEIYTEPMTPGNELICALAGPVGSFFLLLFLRTAPPIALCGLVQGLYNLLPVMPLDGGRVMNSLLIMLYPAGAERIMNGLVYVVIILLILAGITAALIMDHAFYMAAALFLLARKFLLGKIPCKEARKGVQ